MAYCKLIKGNDKLILNLNTDLLIRYFIWWEVNIKDYKLYSRKFNVDYKYKPLTICCKDDLIIQKQVKAAALCC